MMAIFVSSRVKAWTILREAMLDDPFLSFYFGIGKIGSFRTSIFLWNALGYYSKNGKIICLGDAAAVLAIWPPGEFKQRDYGIIVRLLVTLLPSDVKQRWEVAYPFSADIPEQPHTSIAFLGVRRRSRQNGEGSRLFHECLKQCTMPVYVETASRILGDLMLASGFVELRSAKLDDRITVFLFRKT